VEKPDKPANLGRPGAATHETMIDNYGETIIECPSVDPG
jgi:hypothetical protein